MAKRRYAIVIEGGEPGSGFSAYVPDLPGCVTVGDTVAEVRRNMAEAISLHLHGLHEAREPLPPPTALADYVEIEDDPTGWAQGVVDAPPLRKARGRQ
jgi:predicted RNase H-like HicB family nuclease